MSAVPVLLVALVAISAVVSATLAVAWIDLGRSAHARTWGVAFAVATAAWACCLAARADAVPRAAWLAVPALIVLASALVAHGFRQRAGLPDRRRAFLALSAVHAGLLPVFRWAWGEEAWVVPLALFNAALYWRASRTLLGRRQGERLAERVAEAGLCVIASLHMLAVAGLAGRWLGLVALDLPRLGWLVLLLLPSATATVGLYTVILITADLADQTRRLAATDRLTGLLNRRGFEDAAAALFGAARRDGRPVALVMVDVDHFKRVNDRFGHPAGDRVLQGVCGRIAQSIGRRDLFARVGGEEFAAVLVDVDEPTAACAVEVMRAGVEAMAADLPVPHRVTASFGVAAAGPADGELDDLIARADRALYRSKSEGRNRVTVAA